MFPGVIHVIPGFVHTVCTALDIRQPAARRRWLWLYGSVGTQRARDLAEKTRQVSWCRKLDVDAVFPHPRIISLHVTLYTT